MQIGKYTIIIFPNLYKTPHPQPFLQFHSIREIPISNILLPKHHLTHLTCQMKIIVTEYRIRILKVQLYKRCKYVTCHLQNIRILFFLHLHLNLRLFQIQIFIRQKCLHLFYCISVLKPEMPSHFPQTGLEFFLLLQNLPSSARRSGVPCIEVPSTFQNNRWKTRRQTASKRYLRHIVS